MKRAKIALAAAAVVLGSSLAGLAIADESFFGRMNPLRLFRTERVDVTTEQRLQNIRSKLAERGLDQAEVDRRVADIRAARASADRVPLKNSYGPLRVENQPRVNELRAKLKERGLDAEQIDARIARFTEMREYRASRANDIAPPNPDPGPLPLPPRRLDADERAPRIKKADETRQRSELSREAFRSSRGRRR